MSTEKKTPPIKKIIKKGHGGHHGGSWKVAYADFVTAMMAFFLVMWLLAISSEQGKAALADYFDSLSMKDAVFNGGMPANFDPASPNPSVLDGGCFQLIQQGKELDEREERVAAREQALEAMGDDRPEAGATRPTDQPQDPDLTELPEGVEGGEGADQPGVAPGEGLYTDATGIEGGALTDAEAQAAQALRESKQQLAGEISQAVAQELGGNLDGQLSVEIVPGGLKIQLIDKERRPLFISGQPSLTPTAQAILLSIAKRLVTIPNKISIEGHTDSVSTLSQELTNWELSTARASAARRALARNGVSDDRLTMVAGFAATQPLPNTNPMDPVNRRISIMIWDESANISEARVGQPQPPAGSPPAAGSPETGPGQTPTGGGPRPMPRPLRPSTDQLEQQLLEDTLSDAATPDTSTAGPRLATPPKVNGDDTPPPSQNGTGSPGSSGLNGD
ncbi:MAG: OmpA family protein [Deltaproteobacteria bacterium]|jgi:chemotaxis protein MotB|nr:OmpA family protein [Deltaproteobacteria bacterium]